MVVQEVSATIPPGGEEILTAYVICIDPTSSAPDDGEAYSLGAMESGELLQLAQCVCYDNLEANPMGGLEVMLAGWSLRGEDLAAELGEQAEGAAGDLFGEEGEGLLGGLLESFAGLGSGVLERCGIELPATPTP